jgi:hypothetical protein
MQMFENLDENQRLSQLVAHAWKIEQREIERQISQSEMDLLVDQALALTAENDMYLQDADLSASERTQLMVQNSREINSIAVAIKTGKRKQYEDVYLFPDYEKKQMHILDRNGHQIEQRPLLKSERQSNIFNASMS